MQGVVVLVILKLVVAVVFAVVISAYLPLVELPDLQVADLMHFNLFLMGLILEPELGMAWTTAPVCLVVHPLVDLHRSQVVAVVAQ